jgi:hypothetical protein
MEGMLTGLVLLGVFAALIALLPFAYAGWRRLTKQDGELQMWRAMSRVGVSRQEATGEPAKLTRAVRRCVLCPSIEECDNWLASVQSAGLDEFCPNARFFDELKSGTGKR